MQNEIKNLSWTIEVKEQLITKIKDQLGNFLQMQGPKEEKGV
jgi:hypothetical protein